MPTGNCAAGWQLRNTVSMNVRVSTSRENGVHDSPRSDSWIHPSVPFGRIGRSACTHRSPWRSTVSWRRSNVCGEPCGLTWWNEATGADLPDGALYAVTFGACAVPMMVCGKQPWTSAVFGMWPLGSEEFVGGCSSGGSVPDTGSSGACDAPIGPQATPNTTIGATTTEAATSLTGARPTFDLLPGEGGIPGCRRGRRRGRDAGGGRARRRRRGRGVHGG